MLQFATSEPLISGNPVTSPDKLAFNPHFLNLQETLKNSIRIAYDVALVFEDLLKNEGAKHCSPENVLKKFCSSHHCFSDSGWTLQAYLAKSGLVTRFETLDCSLISLFNSSEGILVLSFRGSLTKADWATNCDLRKIKIEDFGKLVVHQGFWIKAQDYFEKTIDSIMGLVKKSQKPIRIFITGHSQGAALAHFFGLLLAQYLTKNVWPEFQNAKYNTIQLYRIACPKTIATFESQATVNKILGTCNDLVHNTAADPVPHGPFFGPNAFTKTDILKNFTGFVQSGVLALQPNPDPKLSFVAYRCMAHFLDAKFRFQPSLIQPVTTEFVKNGTIHSRVGESNHSTFRFALPNATSWRNAFARPWVWQRFSHIFDRAEITGPSEIGKSNKTSGKPTVA